MVARAVPGLQGLRDRALLLLGFAGAFRRSELVALNVADIGRIVTSRPLSVSALGQHGSGQGSFDLQDDGRVPSQVS